jgi:nucleoside-diphosphate-sugar epimerase
MKLESPILVTGASGFVASQIVADLLEHGYRVRGTVRAAGDTKKYEFLTSLPGADERLELVSADLLKAETFPPAIDGCEVVLHTASPYVLTVDDPQRDLVQPAVQGTLGVLKACQDQNVRRVVLTSSVAAITDEPSSDYTFSEKDWNEKSSLIRNPYYFSKTQAERAAWKFMEEKSPNFDLVVVNPFVVLGPSLTPSINVSNRIILDLATGKYPGLVNISWGLVDVRDVAQAHRLAFETEKAQGRYLCAAQTRSMREVAETLSGLDQSGLKVPTLSLDNPLGDVLTRLGAYFQPKGTAQFLRTNLGRRPSFDNSKIQKELGLEFRPIEVTLKDTVADLKKWGHF